MNGPDVDCEILASARIGSGWEIIIYIKQMFIIITSSVLFACASSDTAPDSGGEEASGGRMDCIFTSSIRGYSVLNESNLIVEGARRSKYHVVLQRRAYGINSTWGIGFDSPSSRVCAGFSEVIFQGNLDNESIRIASIRELSPEEYEGLMIQYGKMKPEIEQTPAPREVKGAEVEELDTAATDDSSGN
jgi:hypothetical protein